MSMHHNFMAELEAFLSSCSLTETTFGKQAVNDGKLIGRLRAGGDITLRTADRLRDWMREYDLRKSRAHTGAPSKKSQVGPGSVCLDVIETI